MFFFKQKTAYEMRISDWSSDVCSSDLQVGIAAGVDPRERLQVHGDVEGQAVEAAAAAHADAQRGDLGAVDVDARGAFAAAAFDVPFTPGIDQRLFDPAHVLEQDRKRVV